MKKPLLVALMLTTLPFTSQAQDAAKPQPKPCATDEYRHFDFWIGEWEVRGPKGQAVGSSKITSILGGCAISEAWTGASGYKGVSYNFYDNIKKQWHQTWIGGGGGALYLDGGLQDGKMVLQGEKPDKDGVIVIQKITWTPMKDGRVSQHWQTSKDDGKTWQNVFLGYYSKK